VVEKDGELLLEGADFFVSIDEDSDVEEGDEVTFFGAKGKVLTSVEKRSGGFDAEVNHMGVSEHLVEHCANENYDSRGYKELSDGGGQPNHADRQYQDLLRTISEEGHEPDDEPEAGAIALCGLGTLGLITSGEKQAVTYPNGNEADAWVGVHLERHDEYDIEPGDEWSSRNPDVVVTSAIRAAALRALRESLNLAD
jgi:hypothetical protein